MAVREILKMGDPRLLRVAQPVTAVRQRRTASADHRHAGHHARGQRRRSGGAADRRRPATGDFRHRSGQSALSRCAADAAHGADQSGDHAAGARAGVPAAGGRLGRLPVGAGPARDRAAPCPAAVHRLRPYGDPIEREVDGFHARVVQHECDHLQGVLYPMRVRDFSRFGFTEVLFPGRGATGRLITQCWT